MRAGTCKHFIDTFHNRTCLAGVCFKDVTPDPDSPGGAFRIPCNKVIHWTNPSAKQLAEFAKRGTCDNYEEPSTEDIAKYEAEMDAHMDKMNLVIPIISRIKQEHSESWAGIVECPSCKGRLHVKLNCFGGLHGPQKRLHGKCETDGCLSWME